MHSIESLRTTIQRYDSYYDSTNNKASFLLALATAMLGGAAALVDRGGLSERPLWLCIVVVIGLVATSVGIGLTLFSVTPYTKGGVTSLMFFGSVSKLDLDEFRRKVLRQTAEDDLEDHVKQVHTLATGLSVKFHRLKVACFSLGVAFLAAFVVILHMMFN